MCLGVDLLIDVIDDVILQPLNVNVHCLEEGRKARGRNAQTLN